MDLIVERCAGLDVHRDTVVATVGVPARSGRGRHRETVTFRAMTAGLEQLAGWLAGHEVTLVGMEATGVYWRPVFRVLEPRFTCWLLNAQHLHNVPGRKTDVADSLWICQLVEHGLVRPSFVPPPLIRDLRELTRTRKAQVEERTRVVQRLEKLLQDAGVKLTSVASGAWSKSARAMVEAMIAGQTDPAVLADLAKARMRSKIPQLTEALASAFRSDHHGVMAARLIAHIDFLEDSIARLDARVDEVAAPLADIRDRICTIPGVGKRTAEVIIAECGVDMTVFPTAAHLASWAGICPGNRESGGRRQSGRTRRGDKWLRKALTEAAKAGARTKGTYFAARHQALRRRRGVNRATGAIRHDILVAYWHMLTNGTDYHDLGADWLERRSSTEHRTRRLVHQLEQLGHTVTLETTA